MIRDNRSKTLQCIGFLTVTRDAEQGLFGGYLVLNTRGRPLEFHCTAPVRPNRAQQILYGPTLDPYLCGERIGQTLLKTSKRDPLFVLTDEPSVLAAREIVPVPMLLIRGSDRHGDQQGEPGRQQEGANGRPPMPAGNAWRDPIDASLPLKRFALGPYDVAVATTHATDGEHVTDAWSMFADQIDLAEPFERIREAIGEARNRGR